MRTNNTNMIRLSAVAAGALLLAAPALGATHMKSSARHYHMEAMPTPAPPAPVIVSNDMSSATEVFVGGVPIMRYRVAAGGFTPEQRADATQMRLNKLLGQGPIFASDITVEPQGDDAVVLVKGQLLFTADAATAAFNTSTSMELANIWAQKMRDVLPGLTYPTNGAR